MRAVVRILQTRKQSQRRNLTQWTGEEIERRFTGSIKHDRYAIKRDTPEMEYKEVLPMWVADMDLRCPQVLIDNLHKRVDHPIFGYSGPDFRVKAAIINYLKSSQGVGNVQPSQLVFLPGLVVGLNLVSRMAARAGHSTMTATPIYPPFMTSAKNSGTQSVGVPLVWSEKQKHFTFDFAAMERNLQPPNGGQVGVFLLCNPHNPVGRVFSREEILDVVRFCKANDLILVSDEVHCDLILNKKETPHIPVLGIQEEEDWIRENSIIFHAPSKTFNVAGLCASFAVVPGVKLRGKLKQEMSGITADISPFGYVAMDTLYGDYDGTCAKYREELVNHLHSNVTLLQDYLRTSKAGKYVTMNHEQQATYLCWLDARKLKEALQAKKLSSRSNMAVWFEEEVGLGMNDGRMFGPGSEYDGFVRINLGCTRKVVEMAISKFDTMVSILEK